MDQMALFKALDFSKHVLRVEAYEAASAARIQGVGLADPTLRDEARSFVRLKIKHSQIYSIAFATLGTCAEVNNTAFHRFEPPGTHFSSGAVTLSPPQTISPNQLAPKSQPPDLSAPPCT